MQWYYHQYHGKSDLLAKKLFRIYNGKLSLNIAKVETIDSIKQKRKIYANKTKEFFERKLSFAKVIVVII